MRICAFLCALLIAGCVSHGVQVSAEKVAQFKPGVTTEADVVAALGQPTSVTSMNGQRLLSYAGAQAQARPTSFIPIVGLFAGGADVRYSMTMFKFGADGKLVDTTQTNGASGANTGLAAGTMPPVADQPRKIE